MNRGSIISGNNRACRKLMLFQWPSTVQCLFLSLLMTPLHLYTVPVLFVQWKWLLSSTVCRTRQRFLLMLFIWLCLSHCSIWLCKQAICCHILCKEFCLMMQAKDFSMHIKTANWGLKKHVFPSKDNKDILLGNLPLWTFSLLLPAATTTQVYCMIQCPSVVSAKSTPSFSSGCYVTLICHLHQTNEG